jgi:hypothetical protein
VALTHVEHGAALVDVVKRLVHTASRTGIRPTQLLLDRGFYRVAVIRYRQAARYPFIRSAGADALMTRAVPMGRGVLPPPNATVGAAIP